MCFCAIALPAVSIICFRMSIVTFTRKHTLYGQESKEHAKFYIYLQSNQKVKWNAYYYFIAFGYESLKKTAPQRLQTLSFNSSNTVTAADY